MMMSLCELSKTFVNDCDLVCGDPTDLGELIESINGVETAGSGVT